MFNKIVYNILKIIVICTNLTNFNSFYIQMGYPKWFFWIFFLKIYIGFFLFLMSKMSFVIIFFMN